MRKTTIITAVLLAMLSMTGAFADGVTAESGRFVFDEYVSSGEAASGPLLLRLTNGAQYDFASDALDIDLSLGRDSRLLLANVAGAEGSPSETRVHRFDWAGELCVDLGKADLRNAQLHVDGLHVREGASISLSRDDLESALRAQRPALALDDGDALWLVASDTEVTYENTIGGTADLPDVMITGGSDTAALSGETTVGLAEGVTGTFTTEVVDQIGAKHGLAVENRLVKAAFSEEGRLELEGSGTGSPWDADNSWRDVDILSKVEGAGEMLVSNTVGLFLGEGTNYSGRVDLEKGAALTLSGASFGGATVAFAGDATSSLTLLSDQRLRLEGASGGSMTLGADADGAVTVTLTGASTLGTQGCFTLSGRGEDALVLADGARRFFEVEFLRDGNDEHIVREAFARGHQSLEHALGRYAEHCRRFHAGGRFLRGQRPAVRQKCVRGVFGFRAVERAHGVRLVGVHVFTAAEFKNLLPRARQERVRVHPVQLTEKSRSP